MPHELLRSTLDRFFPDGSRRAVLVIGAGLHHHLAAHSTADTTTETWRLFRSWNELLKSVGTTLAVKGLDHQDPTATWEALIVQRTRQQASTTVGSGPAASRVEDVALRQLGKRLAQLPSTPEDLERFGVALRARRHRDLVSLNFDRTLEQTLGLKTTRSKVAAEGEELTRRKLVVAKDASQRLWFPHGHIVDADTMVLGQRSYGMAIRGLEALRESMKRAERQWREDRPWTPSLREEWEAVRRVSDSISWMDLFLLSDLVFIGCSLDRAEMDLWWALHQRARNHALQDPELAPRTLLLHGPGGLRGHLASGPAGVTPVGFDTWDGVWEAVLGRWWESAA